MPNQHLPKGNVSHVKLCEEQMFSALRSFHALFFLTGAVSCSIFQTLLWSDRLLFVLETAAPLNTSRCCSALPFFTLYPFWGFDKLARSRAIVKPSNFLKNRNRWRDPGKRENEDERREYEKSVKEWTADWGSENGDVGFPGRRQWCVLPSPDVLPSGALWQRGLQSPS